jgi:hypothetical protein
MERVGMVWAPLVRGAGSDARTTPSRPLRTRTARTSCAHRLGARTEETPMPKYLGTLTTVLLLGMVLTRVFLLKRQGIKAMKFGNIDKTDFLIPPFAFFYFYVLFAAAFYWPSVSTRTFQARRWAGICAGTQRRPICRCESSRFRDVLPPRRIGKCPDCDSRHALIGTSLGPGFISSATGAERKCRHA